MCDCDEQLEYLSTSECAQLIKRSTGAIRNLAMRRRIPFRKPGGRLVFIRSEIQRWIEDAPGVKPDEIDR